MADAIAGVCPASLPSAELGRLLLAASGRDAPSAPLQTWSEARLPLLVAGEPEQSRLALATPFR